MSSSRKAPEIHIVDSGVAARLLRLSAARLSSLQATALTEFGHLLETFVVGEILKQARGRIVSPGSDIGGLTTVMRST